MSVLTPAAVDAIIADCFLNAPDSALQLRIKQSFEDKTDPPEGVVIVEGVVGIFVFDELKLELHRSEILELLNELPQEFHDEDEGGGGGWSFLNACNDRHGNQWTGNHAQMEALFCLGMGIGAVESQLPRELWSLLPGSVPYYKVVTEA